MQLCIKKALPRMAAIEITPEMLTLASIVSVKIQTCITKFEDEEKRRKKCVAVPCTQRAEGAPFFPFSPLPSTAPPQVHCVHD